MLTQEVIALIVECVREGNYQEVAAQWAGVSSRTLTHWLRLGRKNPNSMHGELLRAVQEAEAEAERKQVERIWRAAAEDPKHAEWWLERKFPQRWGSQKAEVRALERKIAELEKQLGAARSAAPAGAPVATTGDDTLI